MSNEVKVGILFLGIALLVAVVALYMTDITTRLGTYTVYVYYKDVKGLAAGADVLLSGVKVGKVAKIDLESTTQFPDRPVRTTLLLNKKTGKLFETDYILIEQGSLLGDRFVSVRRPTKQQLDEARLQRGKMILSGAHIAGGPMIGFASLSDRIEELINQFEHSLAQFTDTYASDEMREQIRAVVGNVTTASAQAKDVLAAAAVTLARLDVIIQENQGAVRRTVSNIETASREIRDASTQVSGFFRGLTEGPTPANLALIVANVRKTTEDLRATAEAARGLLADPQNQERIRTSLANFAEASASLKQALARVDELTGDPALKQDLQQSLENLNSSMENLREMTAAGREFFTARENLDNLRLTLQNARRISEDSVDLPARASVTLDRVDGAMGTLHQLTSPFRPVQIRGTVGLEATSHRALRGDLDFDLYYDDPRVFWRIGARDVGKDNLINLQRAIPLNDRASLRAGLFAGQLGVGLDYMVSPSFRLEAEAWNAERSQIDLRALWQVSPDLELTAGVADAFKDSDPFVGLQKVMYFGSYKRGTEQ